MQELQGKQTSATTTSTTTTPTTNTPTFQKKGKARLVSIPGSRPSLHNSQLLLSTGLPSLDHLLGGGVPVGSIFLLEEDRYDVYSKLFLKYFLAEGIMCGHMLTVASLDVPPSSIISTLPASTDQLDREHGFGDTSSPTVSTGAYTTSASFTTTTTTTTSSTTSIVTCNVNDNRNKNDREEKMRIAWRYQNQRRSGGGGGGGDLVSSSGSGSGGNSGSSNRFGYSFDLTSTMGKDQVSSVDICLFGMGEEGGGERGRGEGEGGGIQRGKEKESVRERQEQRGGIRTRATGRSGKVEDKESLEDSGRRGVVGEEEGGVGQYYHKLLRKICERIKEANLSTNTSSNKAKTNVMRIAIHSLVSPLWGPEFSRQERDDQGNQWAKLTTFFYQLRSVVRSSFSVCLVTVPSHLFVDPALRNRLRGLADFVVGLESFQGSDKETNPIFKDYHGLFHIVKLAAINTLVPPRLEATDWVFKLRRRRMVIEKLHLPPELGENVSRAQEEEEEEMGGAGRKGRLGGRGGGGGCGGNSKFGRDLEF